MESKSNLYKTLFDKSTDAVLVIEPQTLFIVDANESAKKLLKIADKSIKKLNIPEFEQIYNQLLNSISGNILSNMNFNIDNEVLILEVRAGLIEFNGNKLIHASLSNPEEKNNLTERLIQADKLVLLGQLSAGVAHEIRNPLAAVNLNLQLLARKYAEGSSEYNSIQTALQGVDRISKIVEITLDFSKPSTPDIQEININSIIPTSLELVESELKKKEIIIETILDKSLPLLSADAKQLQQVLINLLTNAADSINGNGKITLRTYADDGNKSKQKNVIISIEDNGIGISKDEMQKIFNPFFTKKSNGTGLGLSISQRIIQQHNGKIDVISKIGKGSIFNVYLPA